MPNHVHVLISFLNARQRINTIIGNGKRFMAYEIIEQLKTKNEIQLLERLADNVETTRKRNKKLHEVWDRLLIGRIAGVTNLFIRIRLHA